jgi:hypothetical protein
MGHTCLSSRRPGRTSLQILVYVLESSGKGHWTFLRVVVDCIVTATDVLGRTTQGSLVGVQRRKVGVEGGILSFVEPVVIPIRGLDFYLASRLVIENISPSPWARHVVAVPGPL